MDHHRTDISTTTDNKQLCVKLITRQSHNNDTSRPYDNGTSTLQQLHWLPVQYRITYKLCLLTYLIHTFQALSYISDIGQDYF